MNKSFKKLQNSKTFNTFFSHAMRPFAALGMLFIALGAISFFVSDDFVLFHKFFFLNYAVCAIYGAFLLTALPDWMHYKKSIFKISIFLFSCLILALLALIFSPKISAFFIFIFWLALFIFAFYLAILDKNTNNFSILVLLFCLALFAFCYFYSGDGRFLDISLHLHSIAIAIISFRISVVLGYEALKSTKLKDPVFIPNAVYKNLQITFLSLLIISLFFASAQVSAFIAIGVGAMFLATLKELHFIVLLRKYYVLSYYFIVLFGGLSYLLYGAALLSGAYSVPALHLIAISFILGAIFFVLSIAGSRHSGLTMNIPKLGILSVFIIFSAGIARWLLAILSNELYIIIPSILLLFATLIFSAVFLRIFSTHDFTPDPE